MKEYRRKSPEFALCGLNCCLCPRHQTEGVSRCPGCGGETFSLQHPTCAVVTCSGRHGGVEYCFQCEAYPCERYGKLGDKDSFITYRNVGSDLEKARTKGIDAYLAELSEKTKILEHLLERYNDGKRKGFFCLAVNLLELPALREIVKRLKEETGERELTVKEKIALARILIEEEAARTGIELKLRK